MKTFVSPQHQALCENAESLEKSIAKRKLALPSLSKTPPGKGVDSPYDAMAGTIAREEASLNELNGEIERIEGLAAKTKGASN